MAPSEPPVTADGTTLVPVDRDVETAVRLGREAVSLRPWIADRGPEIADRFERALRAGAATGALLRVDGTTAGIALWTVQRSLGLVLDLWYVVPSVASVARYQSFLEAIRRGPDPVVFVPGEIPGLRPSEEERLMAGLGYARYGRSEMQRPADAPPPPLEMPEGCSLRPVTRRDEAELVELHWRAYHGRFDRYLFLEDMDERTDAQHLVRDLFDGRWGEPSPTGSQGIEREGRLLGVVLSVRRGTGALIADVMVDPELQGQGIGRALLSGTVRALAANREVPIVLNVTEGNARALRLYERLGFVRTLGPSLDWYDRGCIPVPPEDG